MKMKPNEKSGIEKSSPNSLIEDIFGGGASFLISSDIQLRSKVGLVIEEEYKEGERMQ